MATAGTTHPFAGAGEWSPGLAPEPTAPPRPSHPSSLLPAADAEPAAPGDHPASNERLSHEPPAPPRAPSGSAHAARDTDAEPALDLTAALHAMVAMGGSDLHLTVASPPMVRVRGSLVPLPGHDALSAVPLREALYSLLTQRQRARYEEHLELDLAHSVPDLARFRVNVYRQRDALGAAFRVIPHEIKSLDALDLPRVVGTFATMPRGLVLVTGPTGSGKSTTLAAIIDRANRERADHIMTVEDPIEFLHAHKRCLVNQREVGEDTHSFAAALKHVLRQDPDIILVGELRDLETISVAITAAETGHLVFATLHTQDAAQTIDRLVDVFPSGQQDQIRTQLASALQGVVCQTLLPTADGRGRAAATEVMIATPAIRNLVREGKTHQVYSAMQAGGAHGMHTMDQHLAHLVTSGKVTYEVAVDKAHHLEDFRRLAGRA